MEKWQEYEPDIVRIATGLTPDEMLRDDLTQEMRIHIWRSPEGKTKSWYLSSARWRALKFMTRTAIDCPDGDLDRQVILYGVLGDIDPEAIRFIPSEWQKLLMQAPLEAVPEAFALSVEMHDAVDRLTARQQQVLYAIAQGFTQEEVAKTLSVSRRTVASELTRIRAAFREFRNHTPTAKV